MNFTPPKHLRKGQSIINFLQWLVAEKPEMRSLIVYRGITSDPATDDHMHIADIFHVPDDKLEALWDEYVADCDYRSVKF